MDVTTLESKFILSQDLEKNIIDTADIVTLYRMLQLNHRLYKKVSELPFFNQNKWYKNSKYNTFHKKDPNEFFWLLCDNGDIEYGKKYFNENSGRIDLHFQEAPFYQCCKNGNLKMAQWIYNELGQQHGQIDIHTQSDYILKEAIKNGHTSIVNWLTSLD